METGSANLSRKKLLTAIAIVVPLAYFLRLNSYQLLFEEPRRALVALEMLLADNWLVPTTNGALYYNKPPLYNWVLIGFMSLLGKAEWVIRLPSVLSLFATAALHYQVSKNYIGKQAALLSALFYLSSADILFYFSLLGEIDLFFALIVYLQCVLIFHFYQKKQWHWLFLCSYLLTAAGVLTKGIPSLFFQGITLLLIFLLNKDLKKLFSLWHLAGIFLLLLTCGGYFYLYSLRHDPGPFLARLFTETFSRTVIENSPWLTLKHLFSFPVMLVKISAPWVLLFLLTFRSGWKQKLKINPFLRFCFWFCLANGLIYMLSPGTRERYLYMFFPFIYSLLASAIGGFNEDDPWIRRFYLFVAIVTTAGIAGMGVFGMILEAWPAGFLCILLALALGWAVYYFRISGSQKLILATVLVILTGRIGFDLVILPTKKQNDTYKTDARQMSAIIGREPVYLAGPPEPKTDIVRFAGEHFITYQREEPAYLAFQTSFYLSRYTGTILKYTDKTNLEGFYISPENFAEPDKIRVFYRFNNRLNGKDHWYILYRSLSQ